MITSTAAISSDSSLTACAMASEAARLEKRRVRIGLAVFTEGNAPGDYGKETVAGVAARLLRR